MREIEEVGEYIKSSTDELMFNGLYPSVITGQRLADLFYSNYYSTYIERDLRQLINVSTTGQFQTFIRLLAGRCGTEFNASALSIEVGCTAPTIRHWMYILEISYITFKLHPYYANISKRLTKTPKIYFYDTGLLCFLLGIKTSAHLAVHPLRGNVFENFAVLELLKQRFNAGKSSNLYFYRENKGREADVVRVDGNMLDVFEVKSSQTYNKNFEKNLTYLRGLFGDKIRSSSLIYDGEFIPPTVINIRQLSNMVQIE